MLYSLLLSCKKDNENVPVSKDNEAVFAINISNLKSSSMLKNAMTYSLDDAKKAIFTIQNIDGSSTKYTSSELSIHKMNGSYYTQKIVLKTGAYKLTEFVLLDITGNTIFAAPLAGSQEAQNVNKPLPIEFSVFKNICTTVDVEVLSTENKKPEDFGLSRFRIIAVNTFGFMVGVTDVEGDKLLTAKITVSNGSYSYIQDLDSIANNIVTVIDSLDTYTLTIEKFGYNTYIHTFSIDSIKLYENIEGNLPLLVELKKAKIPAIGLIAYYPFNGNANDESGNGNNGTVYGAILTSDRFGNIESAYDFDGVDDNIIVDNFMNFRLTSWTFTGWINITGLPENDVMIVGKDQDTAGKYNYAVILSTTGIITSQYETCTNEEDHKVYSSQVQSNEWIYFASVRDNNTGKHTLYINGNKVDSNIWNDTPCDNEKEFQIGHVAHTGAPGLFHGVIDDIRVYGYAISEPEIQAIYLESSKK